MHLVLTVRHLGMHGVKPRLTSHWSLCSHSQKKKEQGPFSTHFTRFQVFQDALVMLTLQSVFNFNRNATSVKVIRLSSARGHDRHDKEPDGFSARKTANGRRMRRKTIAKRILYSGYEAYEETPEETGARAKHVFSQEPAKRRKWRELNGEDISSCNADYVKFKTKAFEVDKPLGDATRDADFTMEVLGSLQSRSRAELIAMVLSMQREMDSLREQIRSFTACGKLAQTLEELIEKSDKWLCGSHEAATPSIPEELERSKPPSHISPPRVLSGRTAVCASSEQQGCGQYEVTQTMPQRNGTLPEQIVITADLLEHCNTGTTAQKLTNDLLRSLYDRDCLASHSISGIVNSKRGMPKPALPALEIQAILSTYKGLFVTSTARDSAAVLPWKD
ncbi:uncharacterized protein LOC109072789 isoform X2 [Cyprinus carpio]|uniref:Uncharacterized protein LOC109072789 isoform X2 n=1 Tax=Cyprinus carpio TaxID=7962 RepID=A0A9Q9WJH5_CYPCA|nr:uncharacterized protein LOC109072789 isoform X2 [Cyprinus carpio]